MLIFIIVIVAILLCITMVKSTIASVKISEAQYDDAYSQTKFLAILNGITLLLLLIVLGFLIFFWKNPQRMAAFKIKSLIS